MTKRKYQRIEVIFEHEAFGVQWRGVRDTDGGYRVDSKGLAAKRWSVVVWCGLDNIERYRINGPMMNPKYRDRKTWTEADRARLKNYDPAD